MDASRYETDASHPSVTHVLSTLSVMHSYDILHPTPVRHLKRRVTELEFDSEPVSKRTRLSPDQVPTPHSTQDGRLYDSLNWRERLKSSLLGALDQYNPPTFKSPTANLRLRAWLDAVPYPRADSCPANPRVFSPPSCLPQSDDYEVKRPASCGARLELSRHKRPASGSDPIFKRARLTLTSLQDMSRQESQCVESRAPRSYASSNKAPGTSDAAYIDTLYGHGIVMDLSGRKLPEELKPLKERILQERSSPELDDKAIFAVMDAAEELAYNSEGPINKVLRTSMFPLGYGSLAEGGNTQWNTIAMPNNPHCDNRLSAPKPDAYLAYPRGAKSPWTVQQNNIVNHPRLRPYSQPAKRNTFPALSVELKAESAGGVLTTAEVQAAGSGSHSVNAMRWLLEEAKAAGLDGVDLMQDTVSFSIVSSHRQAVFYLHWLNPKEKLFYMSYLKSYSSFEADSIRGCNNAIKNIIDNAEGPRKIKIGKALVALEPLKGSWDPQPTVTNPPTPKSCFSGESGSCKRGRDSHG